MPPRGPPPNEIVLRTASFAFHIGAKVDPTWPAHAAASRDALEAAARPVIDEEENVVPLVASGLGLVWPHEGVDVDVALDGPEALAGCRPDALFPRIGLYGEWAKPTVFFACAMEQGLVRLAQESEVAQGLAEAHGDKSRLMCVVDYAVMVTLLTRVSALAPAADAWIERACPDPEVRRQVVLGWKRRVDGELTPRALGRLVGEKRDPTPPISSNPGELVPKGGHETHPDPHPLPPP